MEKKGFAIIETIIVVVMMTTSLLLVYSTYNANITNEKKRVYYDDVVDLYKVHEIKNYILENSNISKYLENVFLTEKNDKLTTIIGRDSSLDGDNLFDNPEYLQELYDFYGVDHLILLNTDYETISTCTYEIIKSDETSDDPIKNICMDSFGNLTYDEIDYIRSLGSNTDFEVNNVILIAVFKTSISGKYTYAYISLEDVV